MEDASTSNGGMTASEDRTSSRPRLGPVCRQCRKQKQRCDRGQPCSNCLRRGIPHLCSFKELESPLGHVEGSRIDKSGNRRPERSSRTQERRANYLSTASSTGLQNWSSSQPASPTLTTQQSIGHLWNARGGPSYHGRSYFGHQMAANLMQAPSPELPLGMAGIHTEKSRHNEATQSFRNEKGPYAHIWELVGYLPRKKAAVDMLVDKFLVELNPILDGVHPETFQLHYEKFWDRKFGFDDIETIDLRFLALLFMVIAFGELLCCPHPCSPERQRECEQSSLHFFWAARKCVVIAPTFSGESPDLVRSGILITRYLIFHRRLPESWLTASFAMRMAQAQGIHIDGENWGLPKKVLEIRRRLWCALYSLDRTISLAIGRPYAVNDKHCMEMKITNIWVDEMTPEEAANAEPQPLSDPTPSIFQLYNQELSVILGQIHDDCFSLGMPTTSSVTYDKVLTFDKELLAWKDKLPSYFAIEYPDKSMDHEKPYLYWQRHHLQSTFHFARVTLHRAYVLLPSITNRFEYSRDACISSATADLKTKLNLHNPSMADRVRFHVSTSRMYNSALILAVIAVKDPFSRLTEAIIEDVQSYCDKQRADNWANDFELAEVHIIELCISSVKNSRREARNQERQTSPHWQVRDDGPMHQANSAATRGGPSSNTASTANWMNVNNMNEMGMSTGPVGEDWLNMWFGPTRSLPQPYDVQTWEEIVGDLEARRPVSTYY